MTDGQAIIVKILSGHHEGAQASMAVSSLSIGRESDCDIILSDDDVTAVTLEHRNDGSYVLHQEDEARALEFPCVFMAGGVRIGLGTSETNFADLSHASSSSVEDESAPATDMPAASNEKEDAPVKRQSSHTHGVAVLSVAAGMMMTFAASTAFYWSSVPQEDKQEVVTPSMPAPTPLIALQQFIAKNDDMDYVTVTSLQDGGIQLSGSVRRSQTLAHLRQYTKAWQGRIQTTIVVTASVAQSLRAGLEAYGMALDVYDDGGAHFRIAGVVSSYRHYEKTLALLRDDLAPQIVIHSQVITVQDFASHVRDNIKKENLAVSLRVDDGTMSSYGLLDDHDFTRWNHIKNMVSSAFGSHIVLDDHVKSVPHFAMTIQTVVKGPRSFVILGDHHMVEEGASLSDGFTLASIESDRLLLTHGGHDYDYIFSPQLENHHD